MKIEQIIIFSKTTSKLNVLKLITVCGNVCSWLTAFAHAVIF